MRARILAVILVITTLGMTFAGISAYFVQRDRGRAMSSTLIVEDESRIATFAEKGFAAGGYAPTVVGTGHDALDGGANDCLTKPFTFDELLARIRLRLRESALAEQFLQHPERVLSREHLLSRVGASTSTPARTASISTCATCAERSAPSASRRYGE